MAEQNPNSLVANVVNAALAYHSIEGFFTDLLANGCHAKIAPTRDLRVTFDEHYEEIEAIRKQALTLPNQLSWPRGDLKTHLASLAYEETAKEIAFSYLQLEI